MIIAAILRDAQHKFLFVNKLDTSLSLWHKQMCLFNGGGWLAEVDILPPRAFVPTLKPKNSEGNVWHGGYVSHSRAANVVTLL